MVENSDNSFDACIARKFQEEAEAAGLGRVSYLGEGVFLAVSVPELEKALPMIKRFMRGLDSRYINNYISVIDLVGRGYGFRIFINFELMATEETE